jgi:membrane protein required for beta-lactamase induction
MRSRLGLAAAVIPALALVAGLPFANRLEPVVFGLPFLLFWILGWVVVTPAFLAVAYVLDLPSDDQSQGGGGR